MNLIKQAWIVTVLFMYLSFFASDVLIAQTTDNGTYMEVTVGSDISFRVEGDDNCVSIDWGNGEFGFYGVENFNDLENTEGVIMAFNGDLEPGDYPLISDNTTAKYMVYYTDGKDFINELGNVMGHNNYSSFSEKGGTLTITAADDKYVSGSFNYEGIDKSEKLFSVSGSFKLLLMKI